MAKDNYIYTYYQAIKSGAILAGRWIQLVYEYIVRGLEEKTFCFDQKKANNAIDWIESHCFHVEGPKAPGPFILELWQKALVSVIYGIVDVNGLRQFREIVLVVARKNGKSLLASAIAAYEFRLNGGYGAKIFCLAPKLEQADIIYHNLWQMITLDPEWKSEEEMLQVRDEHNKRIFDESMHAKKRQSDLFIAGTNSTVKKIAFSSKKSDGFNPSLCICDEIAAWEGDRGLKQYEVMKSGQGARPEGLLLSCTTSGYVNDSIFDELIKRCTRFLLGDSKERRLLPLLYMIDDIEKWNDINELRKSNPNLGASVTVNYLLEEIAVAEGSLSRKVEFITKHCCLKQNSSLAWLPAKTVERAGGEPLRLEDFRECYAVAGVDLSQTRDLTAAVLIIERDGQLYMWAHFWLPAEKLEEATERDGVPYSIMIERGWLSLSGDNFIDYHDCYNWLAAMVTEYHIYPLKVGYDRYSATYLVNDLKAFGFQVDDVYQGENLYGVIQETEGILEDGRIHIGDNDLLKSHLLNSAIKMSTERGRGKLIKLNSKVHIDGTAAMLCGMTVRQKWAGEIGEQLKNIRSA